VAESGASELPVTSGRPSIVRWDFRGKLAWHLFLPPERMANGLWRMALKGRGVGPVRRQRRAVLWRDSAEK
jgi:hypothetical protein